MNKLGLLGAAAVATALCFPSDAQADPVLNASIDAHAQALIGTSTGNGGSFVTKAVKNALAWTSSQWLYCFDVSTLSAAQWYEQIVPVDGSAPTNFVEITNIADVDAGHIFAINATGSYAGHAAVIIGEPIDITPPAGFYTPYRTGQKQWALPIVDSTSTEHGQNTAYPDSRRVAGVFTPSIVGTAYLRLYSDEATGEILSYGWSVTSTTEANVFDQSERPFAIGELDITACL
ncbi:hypothetical protein [Polyangium jinanense]|uniref:CHAP domain-containing protein n=1 Tax=Polyangium jinanense TaxID=2829994 RepID=A0A9X3X4H9_9BACT|nr:hypothetical protein [Polyangium jinanense]MDC3959715.1 hypothetical protein [Polyangium jinanense]MDC3984117.1 hypothetical protein [Polyangium jinanense]